MRGALPVLQSVTPLLFLVLAGKGLAGSAALSTTTALTRGEMHQKQMSPQIDLQQNT